jgi:putative redox protein
MNITVKYVKGVKFEVAAGDHRLVCDQPIEHGGENQGPTPPDFLLASLGTCVGYYALQYLKLRSLPSEGLVVTVRAEKAKQPARLVNFNVDVVVPGLEEKHVVGVTRAASACLIHNTLTSPPAISIAVHASEPASKATVFA